MKQLKRDAILAKILEQAGLIYHEQNGQTNAIITEEHDALQLVHQIETITRQIIAGPKPLFASRLNKSLNRLDFHWSRMGKVCFDLLAPDRLSTITRHFPRHQFSPYVELFRSTAHAHNVFELPRGGLLDLRDDRAVDQMVTVLNGWINAIRSQGNSRQFAAQVDASRRNQYATSASLKSLFRKVLRLHPNLHVVRLDLTYQKQFTSWPTIESIPMQLSDVIEHRKALVRFLQQSNISPYIIVYAWKLSYALMRGYNIHLLLLLDRSDDHDFSSIVGNQWRTEITKGKGIFFDCAHFGAGYRSGGVFSHNITEMAVQFEKAAEFMIWPDALVKLQMPKHHRSFGKGEIKGERAKNKKTTQKRGHSKIVDAMKKLIPDWRKNDCHSS